MKYLSILALLSALAAAPIASAQELQGLSYNGSIYSIDFMTGDYVNDGFCGFGNLGSQARSQSGTRWTVSGTGANNQLIRLDSNGNGTVVGPLPTNGIVQSLSYAESSELLYALTEFRMYKVEPLTGFATSVTTPLRVPSGSTFLPSGELLAWNSEIDPAQRGLYLVNTGSGDATQISSSQPYLNWLSADSNSRIVGGSSNGDLWDVSFNGIATYASQTSVPNMLLGADFITPRPAFTQTCNGYRSGSACDQCPCGNSSLSKLIGGCRNSEMGNARLLPSGSESVSAGDLRFDVQQAKSNSFALLLSGSAIAPANAASPCFGLNVGIQSPVLDGLRCAVQNLQRHGARPVDANGSVGVTTPGWGPPNGPMAGIAAQGGFTAGQTRHFQVFYRDLPHGTCQTEVNTTQVVSVPFSL